MSYSKAKKRRGGAENQPPATEARRAAPTAPAASADEDVAVVCGVSPQGEGLQVLRRRRGQLEAGTVRRLEQGKPINGEVVRLQPRADQPLVCDVHVEVPAAGPRADRSATSGPAQVASDRYRKNWDAIYRGPGARNRHRKALPN